MWIFCFFLSWQSEVTKKPTRLTVVMHTNESEQDSFVNNSSTHSNWPITRLWAQLCEVFQIGTVGFRKSPQSEFPAVQSSTFKESGRSIEPVTECSVVTDGPVHTSFGYGSVHSLYSPSTGRSSFRINLVSVTVRDHGTFLGVLTSVNTPPPREGTY